MDVYDRIFVRMITLSHLRTLFFTLPHPPLPLSLRQCVHLGVARALVRAASDWGERGHGTHIDSIWYGALHDQGGG